MASEDEHEAPSSSCASSDSKSEVSTFQAPFFRCPELSKFLLSSPQKVADFWPMMGSEKIPLRRENRAAEQRCYHCPGCLPCDSQLLIDFCDSLEAGLSSCLSVGGRRKAERRAVLVGQALCNLRSSLCLRRSVVQLLSVAAADVLCDEDDPFVSAIVVSTANRLWTDREDSSPDAECSAFSFPGLSQQELIKLDYHAGWTLKRVRDKVVLRRKPFTALDRSGRDVVCRPEELLQIIRRLGEDVACADGRYLMKPSSNVSKFFEYLHGLAQSLLGEEVS